METVYRRPLVVGRVKIKPLNYSQIQSASLNGNAGQVGFSMGGRSPGGRRGALGRAEMSRGVGRGGALSFGAFSRCRLPTVGDSSVVLSFSKCLSLF